jgi:hypothetical protein
MKSLRKIVCIAAFSAFIFGAGASFAMNSPDDIGNNAAAVNGCVWKKDRQGELMYCCPNRGCIYP